MCGVGGEGVGVGCVAWGGDVRKEGLAGLGLRERERAS